MEIRAEDIKRFREKSNISQSTLADIIGVSLRTIQNYESGGKIPNSKYAILHKLIFKTEEFYQEQFQSAVDVWDNKEVSEQKPIYQSKTKEVVLEEQDIPLFDIEVTAGIVTLFKTPNSNKPIDSIKIPNMPKCDGAITITGDSMYPLVKSGDIVFYKVIQDIPESIFYGNMYIVSMDIEGDELVMLKYIQKGKDDEHLLLVSENRHHADKEIHIKHINGIALVKGNIRFNFAT